MGTSPRKNGSGEEGVTVGYGADTKALHAIAERVDGRRQQGRPEEEWAAGQRAGVNHGCQQDPGPRPKHTIAEWYPRTYMPKLLGIDHPPDSAYQMMTRCLDYLTDDVQMEMKMALAGRVMESFHLKPKSFIYDVTSTSVEGEDRAEILQYGYSRDNCPACCQVDYSLCMTLEPTVPLFYQTFPGNTVDSKAVKETIKIQPILKRTEQHTEAHLLVYFVAYLLYSLLEILARKSVTGVTGLKAPDRLRVLAKKTGRVFDTAEARELLTDTADES